MSDRADMEALALRMMHAAQSGDLDTVRECYTADATLWLNVTGKTVRADDHMKNVKGMQSRVQDLRYVDIRVTAFEGGYVQQHLVTGKLADGSDLHIPACFVVKVIGGKIAHRDEYIDSAALAPVLG
ncbi:nuclear transport factor 2 family protein [Nitrobacter sp.]|uniref:nuclear transport factor 2 family protein n=1 Tax=Nitrobacter sp. TaxID=29420 RepID=UPI0029CABD57|nr:nuclear transport factor 2 family protein [Nitrobacter sp.]